MKDTINLIVSLCIVMAIIYVVIGSVGKMIKHLDSITSKQTEICLASGVDYQSCHHTIYNGSAN